MTASAKILIVEDQRVVRQALRLALSSSEFDVFEAATLNRMNQVIEAVDIDLIILDLNMPDGFAMGDIEGLKKKTNALIIIYSGMQDKNIKIESMRAGAVDYIEKPIDLDVFTEKIKAVLTNFGDNSFSKNKTVLDLNSSQSIDLNGKKIFFTPSEFIIMSALISKKGRLISYIELSEALKKNSYTPSKRTLDVKISRLRSKLIQNGLPKELIKTVRGAGYIFMK